MSRQLVHLIPDMPGLKQGDRMIAVLAAVAIEDALVGPLGAWSQPQEIGRSIVCDAERVDRARLRPA